MSIPGRGRWIFGWYLDVWGGIFFVAACGVETEGAVIFLCVFTVLLGIAVFLLYIFVVLAADAVFYGNDQATV